MGSPLPQHCATNEYVFPPTINHFNKSPQDAPYVPSCLGQLLSLLMVKTQQNLQSHSCTSALGSEESYHRKDNDQSS